METVFLDLFNMSINAGWLVLAIVLFRLIFKNAPKALRVIVWGLVGLRLICPFSFESVLSLIPSAEAVPPEIVHSHSSVDLSGAEILNAVGNNQVIFDLGIQNGSIVFNEYTAPDSDTVNPLLIITYIASIVWVVGMAVMLLYTLVSYLRILKNIREATPLKENIWICDSIPTPFILGIIRPRIFLPSSMSEQDMEFVIAHEKAHLKRRDHWWKPLGFALLMVYWFNPVLWVAYVLLCRDIELACDEKVIKEMGADIKKPYSEALINCSVPRKMISVCPLAFGETGVKGRIKSVLNYKKPAFWIIIIAIIAIIVTAVCFMTNPDTQDNGGPDSSKENYIENVLGFTNVTSGSEYDGVSISFMSALFTGDSRYMEILWTNETDANFSFGEEFHILKKNGTKWVECELPDNYAWNLIAYALDANSNINTVTHEYGLYGYEKFTAGEYRFETEFSIESELPRQDYKAWIEFELVDADAEGDIFMPVELVFDNEMFSFVQEVDIAPTYVVTKNMKLTEVFPNGLIYERGTLKEISLNEENWDSRFSSEIWSEGYSYSQIKANNKKAWQLKVDNGKEDISILYLLLEQKDGTHFIAHGMYNNQSENPRNKDDSLIRWLYLVAKNPTVSTVGGANSSVDETHQYVYKTDKDSAYITLTPETQRFSFTFSMFSSYWPRGTYEDDGKYIVLKTDDGKNKYTFKKEDGKLVFIANKSSPMPEYKYSQDATAEVCLSDGAVFTLYRDDVPYNVSFANYSGEFIGGLNADKMYISHTEHLPIFKFDSVDELNRFKSLYGEDLTMDSGMDEIPSFNSVTAQYNKEFFEENSLLLIYVSSSSMSWRYGVESISTDNKSLLINVERTDTNETGDSAMSGWFITIEMDKEELKNYTEFDAIMLEE